MFGILRRRAGGAPNTPKATQPIETGTVQWTRRLDDAVTTAASTGRPVFALFQEVPGCAGCQQFGADVLSDPFVVEVIETLFVPLLIHNNAAGHDAEVLARYDEPAWNYQVVRFLDAGGDDLIPRRDRVWTTGPLLTRMVAALRAGGHEVPAFLGLAEQEHADRLLETQIAQACFWVGEREIGAIDGVVTTEAGFLDGHEVTRVRFDPDVVSLDELLHEAGRRGVGDAHLPDGSGYRRAPDHDQTRQLGPRDLVGLTPAQATKRNALGAAADRYLFPSQRPG